MPKIKKYSICPVIFLMLLNFGLASAASAHQPRYIKNNQLMVIKNPEISQAFYGELKGDEAVYLIDLKKEQELYFQILEPALTDALKDKTVTVDYATELEQTANNFIKLESVSADWKSWYEAYAGDNYFAGPSLKTMAEPGYYFIKVGSPDNSGKYVLVIGEKEEYPIWEVANAIWTLPQIKTDFFNKPPWSVFQGKIGRYLGISLAVLVVVGFMFYRFNKVYK